MPWDFDWDGVGEFAREQGLVPLLSWNLKNDARFGAVQKSKIGAQVWQHTTYTLRLTAELFSVLDVLAANNIPALAHKGPALASLLYGDIALRSYSDVDVLLRPEDVLRASSALSQAGWTCLTEIPEGKQHNYLKSASELAFFHDRILVELQWSVTPRFYSVELPIAEMMDRAVPAEVAGKRLKMLAPDDLLLALAVHGAKHMWERLFWVLDIAALLQAGTLDCNSVLQKARAYRINRILAVALILANWVAEVEIPPIFSSLVDNDHAAHALAYQLLENAIAGMPRFKPETISYFFMFSRLREHWRDRLRMFLRLALTPGPGEWGVIALPAWLSGLYYGVRFLRLLYRACAMPFVRRSPA